MKNKRALEPYDVECIHKAFGGEAVQAINDTDKTFMLPQLVAVYMDEQTAGLIQSVSVFDPRLVNALQSQEAPSVFARLVAGLLHGTSGTLPDAVVHVTEAWGVEVSDDEDVPAEDSPDRAEVLLVSVFTRDGFYVSVCPIETVGTTRRAELGRLNRRGDVPGARPENAVVH